LNTAYAFAFNDCDVDVTTNTPLGTPGVPDDVVLSVLGVNAVAYNDNCMVKLGATSCAIEDTSTVELERNSVSFDRYCNRAFSVDSSHESGCVVSLNICVVSNSANGESGLSFVSDIASSILCNVRIVLLTSQAIIDGVVEG
jgi:hypothetical protein